MEPASILVYSGLDLVGDGLMKLPFLRALRHAYPGARITWLSGKGKTVYAGILAPLVGGLIDEIIEEAGIGIHWHELLHRPLRDRRFDLIIDTQRRVKTTLILRRIRHGVFVSGAAGWRLSDRKPANPVKQRRMVDALLELVAVASGKPVSLDVTLQLGAAYADAAIAALPENRRYAGFAPGAGGVHKRWPLERFIDVARRAQQHELIPVFLLGPAEAEYLPQVKATLPDALFPLQDGGEITKSPLFTIAIGRRLTVSIANDSGTGHMIAAGDAPLVSLFGPTDPAKFAPYVSRAAIVRAQDHGGEDMEAIPVEAVLQAILGLSSSSAQAEYPVQDTH